MNNRGLSNHGGRGLVRNGDVRHCCAAALADFAEATAASNSAAEARSTPSCASRPLPSAQKDTGMRRICLRVQAVDEPGDHNDRHHLGTGCTTRRTVRQIIEAHEPAGYAGSGIHRSGIADVWAGLV